jgi:hypothetical protein
MPNRDKCPPCVAPQNLKVHYPCCIHCCALDVSLQHSTENTWWVFEHCPSGFIAGSLLTRILAKGGLMGGAIIARLRCLSDTRSRYVLPTAQYTKLSSTPPGYPPGYSLGGTRHALLNGTPAVGQSGNGGNAHRVESPV